VTDVEDLLERTLADERRALDVEPGSVAGVLRRAQRLEMRRRVALVGAAATTVGLVALAALLVDGGHVAVTPVPSQLASVSSRPAQPTAPGAAGSPAAPAPVPSPTPQPATS
jgi:hypothetical protein